MNVNSEQTITQVQQSNIKRQLRERKENIINQPIDSIKPFRRHRKRLDDLKQDIDLQSAGKIKQNTNEQSYKLKREYNCEAEKEDIKAQQTKFKYDTSEKQNELQQKLGNVIETAKKNRNQTIASKTGMNSIRKNTNKKQLFSSIENSEHRKEVESIIFDSKVTRFEGWEDKIVRTFSVCQEVFIDKNLATFRQKANKVNEQIEVGLNNIEKMLSELKKQKYEKSQIQSKAKAVNRLQQLQKQFAKRREEAKLQQENRNHFKKSMALACSKTRQQSVISEITNLPDIKRQQESVTIKQDQQLQQNQKEDNVCSSQIQLQGDLGSQIFTFPPEYTSFINRLARQIQKDIEFTSKITQLTKSNNIKAINQIINSQLSKYKETDYKIDQSFFIIQPSEVDPLDQGKVGWFKKLNESQLQQEAENIFRQYHNIDSHYRSKLQFKVSNSVIQLFLEELSKFNFTKTSTNNSESITIGHLLSYLNMRTNNSFRNRSFVKMLKRLGIKSNEHLTVVTFQKLIKK